METINRAIDDAATFKDMMGKLQAPPPRPANLEDSAQKAAIAAWNTEVDRKKAERRERRERERAYQELKA